MIWLAEKTKWATGEQDFDLLIEIGYQERKGGKAMENGEWSWIFVVSKERGEIWGF